MPHQTKDIDALITALKGDLPTAQDEARVRNRLAGIGVVIDSPIPITVDQAGWAKQQAASWGPATLPTGLMSQFATVAASSKTVAAVLAVGVALGVPIARENWNPMDEAAPITGTVESTSQAKESPSKGTNEQELEVMGSAAVEEPVDSKVVAAAPSKRQGAQPSQLERETAVMEQAIAAARTGRKNEALRLLDTHASQFPSGLLSPERERLRGKLLRADGLSDDVHRLAPSSQTETAPSNRE